MLNKTCYVDTTTGNSYIIKIDENFKDAGDKAFESLFECAQFMDAEDGDCTCEEETIKDIRLGFTPIIENNIDGTYALFISEEMSAPYNDDSLPSADFNGFPHNSGTGWSSDVKNEPAAHNGLFEIATKTWFTAKTIDGSDIFHVTGTGGEDAYVKFSGWVREGYRLLLSDNYEPTDEMESPLEKHDWGLMFGIMRGSGSDSSIEAQLDKPENEGNYIWEIKAGSGAYSHPDSCNDYGNLWDYNGTAQGTGTDVDDRISLKLRAEKPNPYFDTSQPESSENPRYLEITNPALRHRGLMDQFYKEYSYWIRNARIVKKKRDMELADILSIDKTVRQKVDDVVGFVKKLQYTVNIKTGLSPVDLEIWYL